jgi:hypothetical protein
VLPEAIEKMESIFHSSPAAATVAEPFLFNLGTPPLSQNRRSHNSSDSGTTSSPLSATLYEMQSSITLSKKRDLLVEVAKWSGDGLKTTCLKMPS